MPRPPEDEQGLAGLVADVRRDPVRRAELVALLAESAPVYADIGMSATARLRGWVLAAFEDVGLPVSAIPYVLEELQSGVEPHLVAAAAKAVRGGEPDPALGPYLLAAFVNMVSRDDTITFEALRPSWPAAVPTSAVIEILASVRWLGAPSPVTADAWREQEQLHAGRLSAAARDALAETIRLLRAAPSHSCCAPEHGPPSAPVELADERGDIADLGDVVLEDQDGERLPFSEFFACPLTVVAFFYTRCANPNKCSLTIAQLAQLQTLIATDGLAGDIGLAAISYDPGFDLPPRLRQYGDARGLRFGQSARMARAIVGHDQLREYFGLQVGYNGSIVNRHGIELYLVDANGVIIDVWLRVQWEPSEVLAVAASALTVVRPLQSHARDRSTATSGKVSGEP